VITFMVRWEFAIGGQSVTFARRVWWLH